MLFWFRDIYLTKIVLCFACLQRVFIKFLVTIRDSTPLLPRALLVWWARQFVLSAWTTFKELSPADSKSRPLRAQPGCLFCRVKFPSRDPANALTTLKRFLVKYISTSLICLAGSVFSPSNFLLLTPSLFFFFLLVFYSEIVKNKNVLDSLQQKIMPYYRLYQNSSYCTILWSY